MGEIEAMSVIQAFYAARGARAPLDMVRRHLQRDGFIHLRGAVAPAQSVGQAFASRKEEEARMARDLEDYVRPLIGDPVPYFMGGGNRSKVAPTIFEHNASAIPERRVYEHFEMSYSAVWPKYIAFMCLKACTP